MNLGIVVLKDRPLEPGHRLYAVAPAGKPRKGDSCQVHCSCNGVRLGTSSRGQYQRLLDGIAADHGPGRAHRRIIHESRAT